MDGQAGRGSGEDLKAIFKIILGTAVRHLLTGLLTLLVAHRILSAQLVSTLPLETAISNDYVFDVAAAAVGAALPALWAIVLHLRSKLKQRLALLLPAFTTEDEVSGRISEAPLGAQIAATITTDPHKL